MEKIAILLAVCILISGCGGLPADRNTESSPVSTVESPLPETGNTTVTASPTPTPTPSPTPTPTATPFPTPTSTPLPPQNPWRSETVIVAVNHSIDPDRNYVGYVQAAINYWSGDGNEFTDYEARFVIKPNATDPDIVVRFVSSLKYCGSKFTNEEDIGGCASHLSKLANPDDPEVIRVLAGLTRESTLHVLKHEFGHIYGLGHSEPPYELMAGTYDYTFISKPDVADRPYPWQKDELKVNVEYPSSFDETENESTKTQVQHALNYYEDGAEGWMETDVTFELVDDSNESDITIEFTENESIESSSLGQDYGTDIDTDDNLEYITYTYININRIELDRRGWHVGYWLGFAFGAKEVPDLPPAFDEPNDDPRTNWW